MRRTLFIYFAILMLIILAVAVWQAVTTETQITDCDLIRAAGLHTRADGLTEVWRLVNGQAELVGVATEATLRGCSGKK